MLPSLNMRFLVFPLTKFPNVAKSECYATFFGFLFGPSFSNFY